MEKRCSKCKEIKPLNDFHKDNRSKDGHQSKCKDCKKQYHLQNKKLKSKKDKERYQEKKEEIKKRTNQYYHENIDIIRERRKIYYHKNADDIKKKVKEWREENIDYVKNRKHNKYEENKNEILEKQKEYYNNNREKILQRGSEYRKNNKIKIKNQKKVFHQKHKDNPIYKYSRLVRHNVWSSYKRNGFKKSKNTEKILGCTLTWFFEEWLNNQYNPPKTHIDHIVPVSLAKNKDEVFALNHFSNMQILNANDNLSKSNKYVSLAGLTKVLSNHPSPNTIKTIVSRSQIKIK